MWSDLNSFTDTVLEYIRFCESVCLPTKIITCYPNNKPWCDNTLRQKIVNKDKAYRNRKSDPSGYRSAKNSLRKAVCAAKLRHKDRIESIFDSGDSRKLWDNMNRITNYKGHKHSVRADDVTLPDQLNDFYARIDEANNTTPTPHRPHHTRRRWPVC